MAESWKMMSLPRTSAEVGVGTLFPAAVSNAFAYEPGLGYVRKDTLRTGGGYWLKYSGTIDSTWLRGQARTTDTLTVSAGWNMIGALSVPMDVRSVRSSPPGILSGSFFGYDRGYTFDDTLKPLRAYWIKSSQIGQIILSPAAVTKAGRPLTATWLREHANILTVTDPGGLEQRLYIALEDGETATARDFLDMPPPSPGDGPDARFGSNRLLEIAGDHARSIPITLASASSPVTISWTLRVPSVSMVLVVGGHEVPLTSAGSLQLASAGVTVSLRFFSSPALPTRFELLSNYPNPFNSATTISYALPTEAKVRLGIYTLLGQEVAILVNEVQPAGYESVRWDAGSHSSGVYFFRLDARSTADPGNVSTQVRKLIYMR
jgi:hypothetical protein